MSGLTTKYASIEYLNASRNNLWNTDYFTFLVQQVWKMDKPINIIDYGCGMGYLGAVLLPLLPKGSCYTGIDRSAELLEKARNNFIDIEYETNFIEQDLTNYKPTAEYDVAICQAVLIHIPSPYKVLAKMVQSIKTGGKVICIEPNWGFSQPGLAGTYFHGMEVFSYEDWGLYQKLIDLEIKRGGCDRYVGIKIPAMLYDLGLINIDIRVNDKGNFTFKKPDKTILLKDRAERREERFNNVDLFIKNGLSAPEADCLVESILLTEDYINSYDGLLPMVDVGAWLISYAEKP